ncbi:MAG: sulfatase [Planctomycetota bacterium]|nr:sulfatase [Planctomycetota bacterium]
MPRPNILYLHSHDTGRWLQPYGHAVPTPNLQRLAEQGTLFRNAFCAAPTCSPSRASLLTGQWPHCSGMIGLSHRGFALNDYTRHLAHTLHAAGYYSALAGIYHLEGPTTAALRPAPREGSPNVTLAGYDVALEKPGAPAAWARPSTTERAIAFLQSPPTKPFFLDVGYFETHRPFPALVPGAGIGDDPRYTLPGDTLPDTPGTRADRAGFNASARILDANIGRVLAALDESGLADNTLVIYTTDHGPAFPGMKCNLTDLGMGVALIIRGPGGFSAVASGGKVCDAMVSHVDVFPTLCELLGITPPAWLQGTSMMPLLRGQASEIRDELFGEVTYHAAYEPQRCVRTRRWKYIRLFDPRPHPILPNLDEGQSKDFQLAHGGRGRPQQAEMLFDLAFDPHEAHNLAPDPRHAAPLREMQDRLARHMATTRDPLLQGPVPAPPHTTMNRPEQLSYHDPSITVGDEPMLPPR